MTPDTKAQLKSAGGTLAVIGAALSAGILALNLVVQPQKIPSVTLAWNVSPDWTNQQVWSESSTTLVWSATNLAGPWQIKTALPVAQTEVKFAQIAPYLQTNIERWTNRRTLTGGIKTNVFAGSQEFFTISITNALLKTNLWNRR